jgi:hypothetical protein
MTPQLSDWRALAEQASKETDPVKLLTIVEVLNRVLEREETFRHMSRKGPSILSYGTGITPHAGCAVRTSPNTQGAHCENDLLRSETAGRTTSEIRAATAIVIPCHEQL